MNFLSHLIRSFALTRALTRELACVGLVLLSGLGWGSAVAQSTYRFDRLTDDVGGRMASTYQIKGDPSGFIWFAGDIEGLLRYDGYEFLVWATDENGTLTRPNVSAVQVMPDGRLWIGTWGNGLQHWSREHQMFIPVPANSGTQSLASNRIQYMFPDHQQRLWVGTTAGLNYIEPEQPTTLHRFAADEPDHPLREERIWAIAERDQQLWVATSGGVYRLSADRREWTHYVLDPQAANTEERGAEVRTVAVVNDHIWAGGRDGVYQYSAEENRFVPVPFETPLATGKPRVNAILGNRDDELYVGAHDGLYRIDMERLQFVRQGPEFNVLPDIDVRSLYEDNDGNLWIGTRDNGILVGRPHRPVFTSLDPDAPDAIANELGRLASAVHYDDRGRLWLGLSTGVFQRDAVSNWRRWLFPGDSAVRRIERIATGPDGEAWIATSNGLFFIDPGGEIREEPRLFEALEISVTPVNELLVDTDGTLWLALWNFGVVQWEPQSMAISVYLPELQNNQGDFVNHLTRDQDGHIWAATRFSGVFEFDGQQFSPVQFSFAGSEVAQQINCVVPSPPYLWLCRENGLVRYRPDTGETRRFGLLDGLPSLKISSFLPDTQSGDWVLTPQGLAWRRSSDTQFVTLGIGDGLPSLSMQRNAFTEGPEGELVIGTTKGAVQLNADELPTQLRAPRTALSRLWVEGKELTRRIDPLQPSLSLPFDSRDILLQFSVLDFHSPERNRLRYRLLGVDDEFGPLTNERTVRYINLPPGDFTLQVQGWSSRGVRGEPLLEIPVEVATPWWQKKLTWAIAAALLGLLVWAVIRLRLRALQAANLRLQTEVGAATHELQLANSKLEELAVTDFLTGLLNRRGFVQRFEQLRGLIERNPAPLTVVLFDFDHFKHLNDTHGHELGDEVLRTLGRILGATLRTADLAARWGGEEFLLALPGTDADGAREVCEKIGAQLRSARFDGVELPQPVTATFGIVCVPESQPMSLDELVNQADAQLYQGKKQGRDVIVPAANTAEGEANE